MFCRNCGNTLEEGAKFCSQCGCNIMDAAAPMPSKSTHGGRKVGIVIAVAVGMAAIFLLFFMFLFIRTRNDDEVNGSKAGGGTAESGEGQEKSAGCDSFTIYETSAVTQWISKNWGVEGLSQCDFTELAQRGTLMVRQPGTNADYAMFVIEEKLLKYEFYRQIHGTYLGAGGEGVNVYLIDADEDVNSLFANSLFAINETGKLEHVIVVGREPQEVQTQEPEPELESYFFNISYGGNGKQESVKYGELSASEQKFVYQCLQKGEFSFAFDGTGLQTIVEYEYDTATNQIEKAYFDGCFVDDSGKSYSESGAVVGEAVIYRREHIFHYIELDDRLSLDGVTIRFSNGEEEIPIRIHYIRDVSGKLISTEVEEFNNGAGG